MTKRVREHAEGGLYHVTARGNDGQPIFGDSVDKRILLRELAVTTEMYELRVVSFCVMSNHVHFTLQTTEPNLSDAMQRLLSVYARKHNRRHDKTDHAFGKPFFSVPIRSDEQLLCVVRYSDRNAVAAGLCAAPEEWPWSSYRAIAGLAPVPVFLDTDVVLAYFDREKQRARAKYRLFVSAGGGPLTEADLTAWLEADTATAEPLRQATVSETVMETVRETVRETVPETVARRAVELESRA